MNSLQPSITQSRSSGDLRGEKRPYSVYCTHQWTTYDSGLYFASITCAAGRQSSLGLRVLKSQALTNLLALLNLEKSKGIVSAGLERDLRLRQVFGGGWSVRHYMRQGDRPRRTPTIHSFHSYFLRPATARNPSSMMLKSCGDGNSFQRPPGGGDSERGSRDFYMTASFWHARNPVTNIRKPCQQPRAGMRCPLKRTSPASWPICCRHQVKEKFRFAISRWRFARLNSTNPLKGHVCRTDASGSGSAPTALYRKICASISLYWLRF